MRELLEAGGTGYLIPAVLFGLVLYVSRGLFGWHGRRSQHRKEFLELWDQTRSQDDLWLEAMIRHWLGTYLPAHVIRLAMVQPDKTQSLIDISELWPLLRYDRDTRTVAWLHRRHLTVDKRNVGRVALLTGYFASAGSSLLGAAVAANYGPGTLSGWIYGGFSVVMLFLAMVCILREDTLKVAAVAGDEWINRINRSAAPLEIRSLDGDRDSDTGLR